ncbi:MAG: hypothetical protein ACJ8ER_17485 [Allosphingosinicella sp.]
MAGPPVSQGDDRRAIYEQDMESVRHREAAKWSKFQTVSAIEGAALYVCFEGGLNATESILLMVAASLLIVLAFWLVLIDEKVRMASLKRAVDFEKSAGTPYPEKAFYVLPVQPSHLVMPGVLAFNVAIVARLAFWPSGL